MRNYFRVGRKFFFFFDDSVETEVRRAYAEASVYAGINRPVALFRAVSFQGPWNAHVIGHNPEVYASC